MLSLISNAPVAVMRQNAPVLRSNASSANHVSVPCTNSLLLVFFVDDTGHQLPITVHMVVALDQSLTVRPSSFTNARCKMHIKPTRHTLILIALIALICVEYCIASPQRNWFCESYGRVMGNYPLFVFCVDNTHHQLATIS